MNYYKLTNNKLTDNLLKLRDRPWLKYNGTPVKNITLIGVTFICVILIIYKKNICYGLKKN